LASLRAWSKRNSVYLWVGAVTVAFFLAVPPVQFVNALTLGAIYALIALGYTMVYGIVELINFAHGDVFMLGTFVSLSILIDVLGVTGAINDPLQLAGMLILILAVTMVLMGAVGFLIEKLAYRPLRNAPKLAPLITAIGVSFILQNIVQLWKGPYKTTFPQFFPMDAAVMLGSVRIGLINVLVIAVALILMVALQLFITRSKTGRAMRATALDPTAAALMGVNIDATISRTFVIGAGIAGAGSVMFGLYLGITDFSIGFLRRPQGIHRRGGRRDRQHAWSGDRGVYDWIHRSGRYRRRLLPMEGRNRLHPPRGIPDVSTKRHPRI
jgi:branched-chain amino acid transport system permease protein